MKKAFTIILSLMVFNLSWSKSQTVIGVELCYATYDGESSKLFGRFTETLPNDSVVSMVYKEYNSENQNAKEGLYVAGRDSLYFFSDGNKKSWFVGDLKRIQLCYKYLVVQQIQANKYSFKVLDLSTQLWSGEMQLTTTHFHQFVAIEDNLYLSYVKNDGGDDYMIVRKYDLPSMLEDLSFHYINPSWQHLTMSFGKNEIYVFESFSKKLHKLDTNGTWLKDTIFPDAYEFVDQEIGFRDEVHYMKNYAGDLFSFTESNNVFTLENLGHIGDFYLTDEVLEIKHLMYLKKGIEDELFSNYSDSPNAKDANIISFCSNILIPTGLIEENFLTEKTTTCYTINTLVKEDFKINSIYTASGQSLPFSKEAKYIDELHLQKGIYILKINKDGKNYRTARLLVD